MGEPTVAEFETWLHPCDVIEHYHQKRELDPKSLVASMLADGLLRAAARPFVLNGRDHGLSLIPRAIWPAAAGSEVWVQARFRFTWVRSEGDVTVSAYDVRIDPEPQPVPQVDAAPPVPAKPTRANPGRGGRRSGKNGEPIARVTLRMASLNPVQLAAYKVEVLASELVEEYRALGLAPPHQDNAKADASGILRALREGGET